MKHRDGILDLVRGLSALLVMLSHLRGFIFLDYAELPHPNAVTKAFYFATGLGHQAVMVFFVLSGYFVGGSVLAGLRKGNFDWRRYALARLSRLWMVLVPALVLTLSVDWLGSLSNPAAYAGGLSSAFSSGPTLAQPASHDALTLIGNLGFVQTVCVPVFGTNGPLWSLANEFWYYVMFPLLIGVISARSSRDRIVSVAQLLLCGVILWWLPKGLVMGGAIWLMGAAVWRILRMNRERKALNTDLGAPPAFSFVSNLVLRASCLAQMWRVIGGAIFLGTLAASKTGSWIGSDSMLGIAFAVWMLAITGSWRREGWLSRISSGLSEISYTLYVVHFPILFWVAAVLLQGHQFRTDWVGYSWFFGLTLVTLAIAAGMWWAFERNTTRVRRWAESWIGLDRSSE
jgi:peptidoglycan/LPS O-acetylase OafA/YrhL